MTVTMYQSINEVPAGRRCVALGTFDGVHRGHHAVIEAAVEMGARLGAVPCAATFHPRPVTLLRPGTPADTLAGVTQRVRLLGEAGAEEVVLLRFTAEIAALSAEEFVDHILIDRLGAVGVAVGEDFRFGHDRTGTVGVLRSLCAARGVEVTAIRLVDQDGEKISSSRIRHLIADGDVVHAALLLGRPASVEGAVMHGDHRGREIGFPTANLSLVPGQQVPADGVYAGWALLPPGERRFRTAISIGRNPHFGDVPDLRVEAHLLDYDGEEIYGTPIRLEFVQRLRGQEAYESLDALVTQIQRDVDDVRAITVEIAQ
ncbi:MAG: bifunctional riboflavin kinase/FAD synthetase [Thermoleophilia bacterium]